MKDGNVKVKVTGSGELSDNDKIVTEGIGKIYTKKDARYIIYETADDDSRDIIKQVLKHQNGCLSMSRTYASGKIPGCRMIFNPKEITASDYPTPYGLLKLSFKTKMIIWDETDSGIEIKLSYDILMDKDVISRNQLKIEIS